MNMSVGTRIGDYEVLAELGEGGMGGVFKVRNLVYEREEALKVILPKLADKRDVAERFIREIRLHANLSHPNIAVVYGTIRVDNGLAMLMQYIDGETIAQRLRRTPMSVEEIVECALQVLSALDYAHGQGVVHRDIKPSNIMVQPDGTVKLMDFGLARARSDQKITPAGAAVGSPAYMSPEQFQDRQPDCRSDFYSLGVALYEMATGGLPFQGDAYMLMQAHLERIPDPPITRAPELPQALNDIILRAMAKDPTERFETARQFIDALKRFRIEPGTTEPLTSDDLNIGTLAPISYGFYRACRVLLAVGLSLAFLTVVAFGIRFSQAVYDLQARWALGLGLQTDDLILVLMICEALLLFGSIFARFQRIWRWGDNWLARRLLSFRTTLSGPELAIFQAHHRQMFETIQERKFGDLTWEPDKPRALTRLIPLAGHEIPSGRQTANTSGRARERGQFDDAADYIGLETLRSPERIYMITGDPGSGKSTVLFEVFRRCSYQVRHRGRGWIPLFIFANELSYETISRADSLASLVGCYFDARRQPQLKKWVLRAFEKRRFLIIIDGLDEFQDLTQYTQAAQKLGELLLKVPQQHRIIVSCREEDYQGGIPGRLLSLLPLMGVQITQYLKRSRAYFKKRGLSIQAGECDSALRGLRRSAVERLLQNYIANPYLLTLIVEYYKESAEPLAQTLREVFERVLKRELQKSPEHLHQNDDLVKFLTSILAPYCYWKTITALSPEKKYSGGEALTDFLQADSELNRLLFGENGYLHAKFERLGPERPYGRLAQLWGPGPAEEWSGYLDEILTEKPSYEKFVQRGLGRLDEMACRILRSSKLAEISEGRIIRMRHRRMQHYFLAVFWDRKGTRHCEEIRALTADAWFCEAFRLFAAIAQRPKDLLTLFLEEYDSANRSVNSDIDLAARILFNASETSAYLPAIKPQFDPNGVLETLCDLGKRAEALLHRLLADDGIDQRRVLQGAYLIPKKKCFDALRNIYGSEILASAAESELRKRMFDSKVRMKDGSEVNYWKLLHRRLLSTSYYLQEIAYSSLDRIRQKQKQFPLSGSHLFIYVIDSALLFHGAYKRNIVATRPVPSSRIPIRMAACLERMACLAASLWISLIVWQSFRGYFTITLVVSATMLSCGALGMAKAFDSGMIPSIAEAYQLPPYLLLWQLKRAIGCLIWIIYGDNPGCYKEPGFKTSTEFAPSEHVAGNVSGGMLSRLKSLFNGRDRVSVNAELLPTVPLLSIPADRHSSPSVANHTRPKYQWSKIKTAGLTATAIVAGVMAGALLYGFVPYVLSHSRATSDSAQIQILEERSAKLAADTQAPFDDTRGAEAMDSDVSELLTRRNAVSALSSAVEERRKDALTHEWLPVVGSFWIDFAQRLESQAERLSRTATQLETTENQLRMRQMQLHNWQQATEFRSSSFRVREEIARNLSKPAREFGIFTGMASKCAALQAQGQMIDGQPGGTGRTIDLRVERGELQRACVEVARTIDQAQASQRVADFLDGARKTVAEARRYATQVHATESVQDARDAGVRLDAFAENIAAWAKAGSGLDADAVRKAAPEVERVRSQLSEAQGEVGQARQRISVVIERATLEETAGEFLRDADSLLQRIRLIVHPPQPLDRTERQAALASIGQLQGELGTTLQKPSNLYRLSELHPTLMADVQTKIQALRSASAELLAWNQMISAEEIALNQKALIEEAIAQAERILGELPKASGKDFSRDQLIEFKSAADEALQKLAEFEDPRIDRLRRVLLERRDRFEKMLSQLRLPSVTPASIERPTIPVARRKPAQEFRTTDSQMKSLETPQLQSPDVISRETERRNGAYFDERLVHLKQSVSYAMMRKLTEDLKERYEPAAERVLRIKQGLGRRKSGTGDPILARFHLQAAQKDAAMLRVFELQLPTFQQTLLALNAETQSLASEVSAKAPGSPQLTRAQELSAELSQEAERLHAIHERLRALNLAGFEDELNASMQARAHETEREWRLLFLGITFVLVVGVLIGLFRSRRPEIGWQKVGKLTDFDGLIQFLRDEGYTKAVHEQAIARLKSYLPVEREALRVARDRIAEVAEDRLRRPGDLNHELGAALLQVAQEIDNVLNRLQHKVEWKETADLTADLTLGFRANGLTT